MRRFVVIRVPDGGRPALVGTPNDFATRERALARIAEIEADHRKVHHTFLDVLEVDAPLLAALEREGVLF